MSKRKGSLQKVSKGKTDNSWLRYTGLATEMLVWLGGATFLGLKTDQWLGLELPVCLIIFPFLALAVILWRLIKVTNNK